MNFGELVAEVAARGFNDMLRDPEELVRLKRFINEADRELNDLEDWPFLEDTEEGPAPLEIEDLGHVLSVSNLTHESVLEPLDRRRVVASDPALDDTGIAENWYREGEETIAVHPEDPTAVLRVRFSIAVVPMVEDEDEPLAPEPYHGLIVDGAVVRCYRNRDNFQAAQFVRQEWERGARGMKHALLTPNHDRPKRIRRSGRPEDYL